MTLRPVRFLTLSLTGDEPPSEFLIFRKGVNDSVKGPVLFDEAAAQLVMRAYREHGVLGMLDLEHLSLDPRAPNYDSDARAAYDLEIRSGELWAVDVAWTAEGADRVRGKKQRYVSPAFHVGKNGRVVELINVALTSLPATHNAAQLIAANQRTDDMKTKKKWSAMDDEEKALARLSRVRKLMGLEDDADVAAAVAELPPEGVVDVLLAAADAIEEAALPAEPEAPSAPSDDTTVANAARALTKLSGKAPAMEVVVALSRLKDGGGVVDDREELIAGNLDKIPEEMHQWARSLDRKSLVTYLNAAKAQPVLRQVTPAPRSTANDLTADELAVIKLTGVTPEAYIATRNGVSK